MSLRLGCASFAKAASRGSGSRSRPWQAARRCAAAHAGPSQSRPTFTPGQQNEEGVVSVVLAFVGGFAATVFLLSMTSKSEAPTRLLPNRYAPFALLDARRCSSPSDPVNANRDGEHVLLSIDAPHYIAPPKLRPEDVLAAACNEPLWRILSVHMKEPSLQIERPYTPLYADSISGPRGSRPLELLIKRYPDGELGRYAHRLSRGEGVELRGPDVTWQGNQTDHLVLLVGGTGITPAYQLLTTILGRPDQPFPTGKQLPRISLLYAASKPSSLLLLPELAKLRSAYGERLRIDLFVESHDGSTRPSWTDWLLGRSTERDRLPVQLGRLSDSSVKAALDRHANKAKHVLVCGPDGMVASVAGPKKDNRQGELGGMLARIGCKPEEVYKL